MPGQAIEVVGESHYQPALAAAAQHQSASTWDDGILVQAALVPEPQNPHDMHAVRIDVGRRTVGYLPRQEAAAYQRALLSVPGGAWGTCTGRILGGGHRSYGIWLHVAPAEIAVPVNRLNGRLIVEGARAVTVTGEEAHQDVLERIADRSLPASVWATLTAATVLKGKYAGQPCVDVMIDGERVGALTKTMSDRYAHLCLDAPATCGALVRDDPRGLQVDLYLP